MTLPLLSAFDWKADTDFEKGRQQLRRPPEAPRGMAANARKLTGASPGGSTASGRPNAAPATMAGNLEVAWGASATMVDNVEVAWEASATMVDTVEVARGASAMMVDAV